MKEKAVILIIIFVGIIITIIKVTTINKYSLTKTDKEQIEKISAGLIIEDLKVIYHKELENDEYLEFQNIKIKDIFKEFECKEEDNTYKCSRDYDTTFLIKQVKSFKTKFEQSKYKSINTVKIVNKNNIKTDIDLFGLIKDSITSKNTILKSTYNIKKDYILQKYAIDYIPVIHSLDLVEGEYSGYILHTSSFNRELYLTNGDDTYLFRFTNLTYFNDEVLSELMNSIIIHHDRRKQ